MSDLELFDIFCLFFYCLLLSCSLLLSLCVLPLSCSALHYTVFLFLFFRACIGLPPQNHMLLEHKLQRDFLPPHTPYINGEVAATKKVVLTNGDHNKPLKKGFYAHDDNAVRAV